MTSDDVFWILAIVLRLVSFLHVVQSQLKTKQHGLIDWNTLNDQRHFFKLAHGTLGGKDIWKHHSHLTIQGLWWGKGVVIIYSRGDGAIPKIARTQNVPPSTIANYVFTPPPPNTCTQILPPPQRIHIHMCVKTHDHSLANISCKICFENEQFLGNILILCEEISATPASAKILGMVFSRSEMALRYMCTQILPPPLWSCALKFCPSSNCLHSNYMSPPFFHRPPLP